MAVSLPTSQPADAYVSELRAPSGVAGITTTGEQHQQQVTHDRGAREGASGRTGSSWDAVFNSSLVRNANISLRQKQAAEHLGQLTKERQALVVLKFSSKLDAKQTRRLEFLDWQIGHLQESQLAHQLDALEAIAEMRAELSKDVQSFVSTIKEAMPKSGRPKR